MSRCKHQNTRTGDAYGFNGSVAVRPYTEENRAAHGGVRYIETCQDCGASRECNVNGSHEENSPWWTKKDKVEA